jgi:hypothetical protein
VGGFAYVAFTESLLDEKVLIHANVGLAVGADHAGTGTRSLLTLGIGAQVRVWGILHGVAEVYRGDPYDPNSDVPATQAGFRLIVSDHVQVDGTVGATFASLTATGHTPTQAWGTLGLRLVTPELW